jgi:hypothetical protein
MIRRRIALLLTAAGIATAGPTAVPASAHAAWRAADRPARSAPAAPAPAPPASPAAADRRGAKTASRRAGTVVVPDHFLRRLDPVSVFFDHDLGPAAGGPEDQPARLV